MVRLLKLSIGFLMIVSFGSIGLAAGSSSGSAGSKNTDLKKAKIQIKAENFGSAIKLLHTALTKEPKSADILNLLGYSYRKSGDRANGHLFYNKALEIDPEHKGTLEYQGELFLMEGDLSKAKVNLKKLDNICTFGCEAYDELKEAIEKYDQGYSY